MEVPQPSLKLTINNTKAFAETSFLVKAWTMEGVADVDEGAPPVARIRRPRIFRVGIIIIYNYDD